MATSVPLQTQVAAITHKERAELRRLSADAEPNRLLAFLRTELASDDRVKVAGVDMDGILRGKIVAKEKFLSSVKSGGFGNGFIGVSRNVVIVCYHLWDRLWCWRGRATVLAGLLFYVGGVVLHNVAGVVLLCPWCHDDGNLVALLSRCNIVFVANLVTTMSFRTFPWDYPEL